MPLSTMARLPPLRGAFVAYPEQLRTKEQSASIVLLLRLLLLLLDHAR